MKRSSYADDEEEVKESFSSLRYEGISHPAINEEAKIVRASNN
jgi:hypothetical protein